MSPLDLEGLAARVEASEGPDRDLDCLIAVAALGYFAIPAKWQGGPVGYGYTDDDGAEVRPGHGGDQLVPRLTASLDATTSLWPVGWYIRVTEVRFGMWRVEGWRGDKSVNTPADAVAISTSEARSRTAAALRALQTEQS